MSVFGPKVKASRPPRLTPTAGHGTVMGWGTGIRNLVTADFPAPPVGTVWDRATALTIPAISRGRNLLCSAVGSLPIQLWTVAWQGTAPPKVQPMTPAPWMLRPDPDRTRAWLLSWTTDDLIFHGRAYWEITARYTTGYPSAFRRLVPTDVVVDTHGEVTYAGRHVPSANVVEFSSFADALLVTGWRTLSTTVQLEAAADRFAATELPVGVLRQTGGEPLDADELATLADNFTARRRANVIAALGLDLEYSTQTNDPEAMQLIEARAYQDLEAARLMNVPPFLIGAPAGTSMTYQNAEQARRDLIDFGALPYINTIEQTLSGPNVTPRGQLVRLDLDAWLRSPFTEGAPADTAEPAPLPVEEPTP